MNEVNLSQQVSARVIKANNPVKSHIKAKGIFHIEHWRAGKLLRHFDCPNGVTNEGKDALLDIMFHADTQITTWYIAPLKTQTGSGVQDDDTYVAIGQAGNEWTESEDYTEGVRQEFVEGPASSQQINNSGNKAVFTMNATVTIEGVLVVGGGTAPTTKGDNAGGGTLWATALFAANVDVENLDELKVTYTVSA